MDALEFLARVVGQIPDKRQVLQRYYGFYANRTRGMRRQCGGEVHEQVVDAEPGPPSMREARRRWAALRRRLFEVDPLQCSRCGLAMPIVACITQPELIDRILIHLRLSYARKSAARALLRAAGLELPWAARDGSWHRRRRLPAARSARSR